MTWIDVSDDDAPAITRVEYEKLVGLMGAAGGDSSEPRLFPATE